MATAPSREQLLSQAKIAEEVRLYDQMAETMTKLVAAVDDELTAEERSLLAVAYKSAIEPRRNSWRSVIAIEEKEASREDLHLVSVIGGYRSKFESEISSICDGILELLDSKLIPSASSADAKAFFWKMKADYNRYLAELKSGIESFGAVEKTLSAYKAAQAIATAELLPTNPTRLGIALNFAAFHYEILKNSAHARSIAKRALDEAVLLEEDSALIVDLLRNNLALWASNMKDDGGD